MIMPDPTCVWHPLHEWARPRCTNGRTMGVWAGLAMGGEGGGVSEMRVGDSWGGAAVGLGVGPGGGGGKRGGIFWWWGGCNFVMSSPLLIIVLTESFRFFASCANCMLVLIDRSAPVARTGSSRLWLRGPGSSMSKAAHGMYLSVYSLTDSRSPIVYSSPGDSRSFGNLWCVEVLMVRMFNRCRIPTRWRDEETIEWIGDRNSGGSTLTYIDRSAPIRCTNGR